MAEITIKGYKCERCGHEWVSRQPDTGAIVAPLVCPKCKSPYWNRPKERKKKKC